MEEDDEIDFEAQVRTVYLRFKSVNIHFYHMGVLTEYDAALTDEVYKLKTKYINQAELEADGRQPQLNFALSYEGRKLDDQARWLDILDQKDYEDGPSIVGHRLVRIRDRDCQMENTIAVCDYHDFKEVMDIYIEDAGRIRHDQGCVLRFGREELHTEENGMDVWSILEHESLEDISAELDYSHELGFEVEMVLAKDPRAPSKSVMVKDHFKIGHLKRLYSDQADAKMLPDDAKLEFDERDLDDEKMVVHYKLRQRSRIVVYTNDNRTITTFYTCASCGRDVQLNPFEVVRCKSGCDKRIVLKKRTSNAVQYVAI